MSSVIYIPDQDLGYVASTYAIYFSILFAFIVLVLIALCCCFSCCFKSKKKNETTIEFNIVQYKKLYSKQVNHFTKLLDSASESDSEVETPLKPKKIDGLANKAKAITETRFAKIRRFICCSKKSTDTKTKAKAIIEPLNSSSTTQLQDIAINIITAKNGTIDTAIDVKQETRYIYYSFDNLNGTEKKSSFLSSEFSDPYVSLENFVNIATRILQPERDHIILHISSPGGYAYKFELAYTHLMRLRQKGFEITAIVNDICASGGYMLACACNRILCSEYAQIGSVGVIAQVHNYHKLSQKIGIEEKTFTTGKYKRIFPSGSEYNEEDVQRMNESLSETFDVFKEIVLKARTLSDEQKIDVFSARTWYGKLAKEKNIVDEIIVNSNDYIDNLALTNEVFIIQKKPKELSGMMGFFEETKIMMMSLQSLSSSIQNVIKGENYRDCNVNLVNDEYIQHKLV